MPLNWFVFCSTGDVQVNMSYEFTELGLLERENASVLNASLRPLADQLLPNFDEAFKGNVCQKPATARVHTPACLVIPAGSGKRATWV